MRFISSWEITCLKKHPLVAIRNASVGAILALVQPKLTKKLLPRAIMQSQMKLFRSDNYIMFFFLVFKHFHI